MKTFSLLAMVTIAALSSSTRLAAQCRPQFNISVYSDGDSSTDGSMIYGYSSTDDSSTLCTCVHSNYQTAAYLQLANGSYVSNTESGETSSVSSATAGDGSYYAFGVAGLTCSCAGTIGGGGATSAINPPAPVIGGIIDYATHSNTIYQGDSSYLEIYGTALTAWGESPTPKVTGDSEVTINFVSYASDGQVNVSYMVAANAAIGPHTILLQTAQGPPAQGTVGVAPASACATPVNFQRQSAVDVGSGILISTFVWTSSTNQLSDLQACTINEYVSYPGTASPYVADSPPFPADASFPNPSPPSGPATAGSFIDRHIISGAQAQGNVKPIFVQPYMPDSFTATQTYRWQCACYNGGNPNNFTGYVQMPIVRKVQQNPNGTWSYTVTEAGSSATYQLP